MKWEAGDKAPARAMMAAGTRVGVGEAGTTVNADKMLQNLGVRPNGALLPAPTSPLLQAAEVWLG